MALIDELKEKLKDVETYISARHAQIREHGSAVEELERQRWDLDLAIAALTPTPDFEAEKATAREQLEREPEIPEEGLGSSLIAMGYGDDDIPSEFAEPIEEAPALNEAMHDEREQPYRIIANVDDKPVTIDFATFHDATECMEELKLRSTSKAELSVLHEGENGEQDRVTLSSFVEAEPQPDGYAPVTNPEAHIQAVEAERYALATNPEADALARARDWYDPKAVADRNRFNPWGGVSNLFGKPKVDA